MLIISLITKLEKRTFVLIARRRVRDIKHWRTAQINEDFTSSHLRPFCRLIQTHGPPKY